MSSPRSEAVHVKGEWDAKAGNQVPSEPVAAQHTQMEVAIPAGVQSGQILPGSIGTAGYL